VDLNQLLQHCAEVGATDLVLTVGVPPHVRLANGLEPVPGVPPLRAEDTRQAALQVLPRDVFERFAWEGDWDGSLVTPWGRYRVNVFLQRGQFALALRRIPERIPSMEEIGLPLAAQRFCESPKGLVLVTGPTGSGKSTTLAAMVDHIADTRAGHIVTVEDPIEYSFRHSKSLVEQREVGRDAQSFERALRAALRQRPDVLVVGEMRDLESIRVAITMAETGHLVLGTLHTNDAAQTVDRIVDVFPPEQQRQVRVQLAACLVGIISQVLLPKRDGSGLVAAFEVMVGTPAVRALIREGRTHQIRGAMQAGAADGHVLMERSLAELVKRGVVAQEAAEAASVHPEDLRAFLGGGPVGTQVPRKHPWAGRW